MPAPLSRMRWRLALDFARLRRQGAASTMESAEQQIARLAPGRTFADVGCMWDVDGRYCFHAVDAGATAVTGVDLMAPSSRFEAEQERRGSPVRFVRGDLHEPHVIATAGESEVVFCSGVLYHSPDPLATLRALRQMCSKHLILWTAAIPEIPGVANGAVFFPFLDEGSRTIYSGRWTPERMAGLDDPFRPEEGYGNWYWGLTPSSVESMLQVAGFGVVERGGQPYAASFIAEAVDH